MISTGAKTLYPNHQYKKSNKDLHIADYTNETGSTRKCEVFEGTPPTDIKYFSIVNPPNLTVEYVNFDEIGNVVQGKQCECFVYPKTVGQGKIPWVLFIETKYCFPNNNVTNLRKSIIQLFETRGYYFTNNGLDERNIISYLIVSFPPQVPHPASSWAIRNLNSKLKSDIELQTYKNILANSNKIMLICKDKVTIKNETMVYT